MDNKKIMDIILDVIKEDKRFVEGAMKGDDYLWVCPNNRFFNDKNCHYELIWDNKYSDLGHDGQHIFAEIHLENKSYEVRHQYTSVLENIDCIEHFIWKKKDGFRLINDCSVKLKEDNINQSIDEIIKKLYKLYDTTNYRLKMVEYVKLLETNYNIILHGAPGTGKTYLAHKIAEKLILDRDNDGTSKKELSTIEKKEQIGFVQFHPSYDYTDFVEGLRPTNNNIGFIRENGIFKEFCKQADKHKDKTYVFIIDEINRGEISKIFGELFFSIDPDYRYKYKDSNNENILIKTQYQNLVRGSDIFYDGFYIPENVYIIGTMNDIDRSVDSMDFAFRRRFTFIEIQPINTQNEILSNFGNKDKIIKVMNELNKAITEYAELPASYHIGAAYFKKLEKLDNNYEKLWKYHIGGLLHEYLRGVDDADNKFNNIKDKYNTVVKSISKDKNE